MRRSFFSSQRPTSPFCSFGIGEKTTRVMTPWNHPCRRLKRGMLRRAKPSESICECWIQRLLETRAGYELTSPQVHVEILMQIIAVTLHFFSLCRRPCKPKHGIGWCDFFGLVRHSACTNYLYLHSGSPVLIMFVLYWRASIPSYAFIVIRARSLPSLTLLSSAPLCPFLATMRTFCRHGLRLRQQPPRPFLVSPKASPFA